ncbi:hypothetical protein PAXINDRAFT_158250 [Paxillus involutus ATCC 200175]|uniref:Inorganic phosphate transporter n=1 Tax=Paxillus involutus ATCC 200175 TaxID=664439 RepID=A0A0C9TJA4_PAXIN|nr:hypothetical protein PAXINDRAFT_158250 [Paxillus involutus ATCC 200175]
MSAMASHIGEKPNSPGETGTSSAPLRSGLQAYERNVGDRPPFILTYSEIKLLGIAGVVWRIVVGLSLIPAFGTLYQRLTLPESVRFEESRKLATGELDDLKAKNDVEIIVSGENSNEGDLKERTEKKAHFKEFVEYFSEWRHAKILIGTCTCWFLLDVAFYGINLNQNVVLQQIGYAGDTATAWEQIFKVSTGNIIITALGFVPGYYVTVLTIEKLGRKYIQIQGFLMTALFCEPASYFFAFSHSNTRPVLLQLWSQCFVQLTVSTPTDRTTYCYPAEVFPTKYRASAHGLSAACGKAGAIISALGFNTLTAKIGTPAVLWIFFGCCIAGAGFTLILPEVAGRDPDAILAEELRER